MLTVQALMIDKVITCAPDNSVAVAARRMEQAHVGGLPVVEGDGRLAGIITSRDIRRAHPNRLVADAMTRRVFAVAPAASVWDAHDLMERHLVERLPVVADGQLVGIITKAEVLAVIGRLTDDLTGLPTASYLKFSAQRSLESGHEICLIFLDVNDFGTFNKQFGHWAGDMVLKTVATALRELGQQGVDFPCRYGGDEFAVLTHRTAGEASRYAATLVAAIATASAGEGWPISASVGVVGGRRQTSRDQEPTDVLENLITLASQASTKAKQTETGILYIDEAC